LALNGFPSLDKQTYCQEGSFWFRFDPTKNLFRSLHSVWQFTVARIKGGAAKLECQLMDELFGLLNDTLQLKDFAKPLNWLRKKYGRSGNGGSVM